MALTSYELIECPSGNYYGYLSHQGGLKRLIELRGPKAHNEGLAHQIYLAFRVGEILAALGKGESTFLSKPDWKALSRHSGFDSRFEELLDIFVEAPAILQAANALHGLESFALADGCLDVAERLWAVDEKLQQFYDKLKIGTPGSLYTPKFARECTGDNAEDDSQNHNPFPIAFHFSNLRMASTMMWYWSLCNIVWSGLLECYFHLERTFQIHHMDVSLLSKQYASHTPQEVTATCECKDCSLSSKEERDHMMRSIVKRVARLPPLDHRKGYLDMVWNVCQSVEYCMQDSMLGAGPAALSGVLSIARITLQKHQPQRARELGWVKNVRRRASERGLRFIGFVTVWDDYAEDLSRKSW